MSWKGKDEHEDEEDEEMNGMGIRIMLIRWHRVEDDIWIHRHRNGN